MKRSSIIGVLWLLIVVAVASVCGKNVVVTLQEPPIGVSSRSTLRKRAVLAPWAGRKDVIQSQQKALIESLPKEWKVAKILRENGMSKDALTSIASNTVTIDVGNEPLKDVAEKLRSIVPFASVELIEEPKLFLFASRKQIGTEEALAEIGATSELDAGKGIKIAICDNGNYAKIDMMNDKGFSLPADLPDDRGELENCNNKLVVSKKFGDFKTSYQESADEPHGIHTAGGRVVNVTSGNVNYTISGIAPGAWMMNYRFVGGGGNVFSVFDEVVEDASDISSNSWGYDPFYNSAHSTHKLFDAAIGSGMTVVEAAGNSGPGQCSVSVLSKDSIAVGAVTKMSLTTSVVLNIKPNMDKDLQCTLYNEKTPKVFYATKYVEIENACSMSSSGISADQNTAIFVQHNSSCSINDVVNAIADINAGLAVIGSDETNPQLRFAIPTIVCSRIQISKFASSYKAKGPGNVTLDFSSTTTGDVVTDFSSRGPSVDMEMTPDVVAPGDDILAAGYSSGGDTRTGYNMKSGTSMACPHVSGAAAIILQHHPEFTPAEVRSALMSTAEYKGVTRLEDGEAAQPLDMGAGRIDLRKAIDPALLFDPPKVDFSLCPRNGNYTQKVTVSKYRSGDMTVSVKIVKHTARNVVEPVDSRIDADPSVFTLTDENPEVVISFMLDAEELDLGDQNAFVVFEDEGTGAEIAHIPLWGQVVCSDDEKKDVLLVVLDQTKCISGLTDTNITDIYTSTLDEMSLTYDIFEYCNDKTFKTLFRLPEKAVGLCYKAVIIAASQTNPSSISSAEGDVRRMMHAGVPVIQMGGTLGKAWGINGEKWETNFIMENEFGVGSPGPWSSEKWINVVDVDVLPGTSMPKLNQNEVDVMYSTDNGDVLIVTQKYQSTGFLYSKTFNSVGITSVVGLDHFVPSSRVEIMSHLYGYVVEDISMFKLSVSSVGKVLTFSIDSDSSDGLDHSIYSVQILWDDGGFTKADVNKPSYTLTHSFAEYGKHNFNVFLVSSYQNAYGYSLSWNLTETSPSSLSMSSSSSSTPSSSPSSTSTASAASIGSKSTTPYSSSFSSDDVSSSTSGNDAYINIGWVAFILAAVLIVVIASMLIALKVLAPKYDKDQLYGRL